MSISSKVSTLKHCPLVCVGPSKINCSNCFKRTSPDMVVSVCIGVSFLMIIITLSEKTTTTTKQKKKQLLRVLLFKKKSTVFLTSVKLWQSLIASPPRWSQPETKPLEFQTHTYSVGICVYAWHLREENSYPKKKKNNNNNSLSKKWGKKHIRAFLML